MSFTCTGLYQLPQELHIFEVMVPLKMALLKNIKKSRKFYLPKKVSEIEKIPQFFVQVKYGFAQSFNAQGEADEWGRFYQKLIRH